MALPSPVVAFPDMAPVIQAAQQRASGFFNTAYSDMARYGAEQQALALQAQQANQAAAQDPRFTDQLQPGYAEGMQGWGQPMQSGLGDTGSDQYASMGFAANVPRSLIGTESSGNFGAYNDVAGAGGAGHDGVLQFSQARRAEAVAAGVIPDMPREQFRADKRAQVAVANWHFNDIDNRIRQAGYDRLIGQTIGGTPITWNGMRAMAHLGGFGGLSKFINSGGSYNPADAYGTSLRDYAITHSRG